MERLDNEGRVWYPKSKDKRPRLKRYLSEMEGPVLGCIWTDIPPLNSQAQERLGYPTQKPEALLERIIKASSNEGEVVLDPFCGCGTAVAAAQKLHRQWIGIDITPLATALIKFRLHNAWGDKIKDEYAVKGEPVDVAGAQALANLDAYDFQCWACGLVNARPTQLKKGADKGIDGRVFFHDDIESAKVKTIILSVKSGQLHAPYVRDLRGVIEREKAEIGVLISMDEPTKQMRAEAASAGFYESTWGVGGATTRHPRLQIITVGELLAGKKIDAPPSRDIRSFKKAPKAKAQPKKTDKQQQSLLEGD
jgi:SAM-dependent methyltransferase